MMKMINHNATLSIFTEQNCNGTNENLYANVSLGGIAKRWHKNATLMMYAYLLKPTADRNRKNCVFYLFGELKKL